MKTKLFLLSTCISNITIAGTRLPYLAIIHMNCLHFSTSLYYELTNHMTGTRSIDKQGYFHLYTK